MMSSVLTQKLKILALATAFFTLFALVVALVLDAPVDLSLIIGALTGFLIAAFEEFYFQGRAGAWMRRLRPVVAIPIYGAVVSIFFFLVQHMAFFLTGRFDQISEAHARYPVTIPALFIAMTMGILALRVVGFIGARNLLHLLVGRYMRPIIERKVLLFLDMKGSTATVEALGAVRAKAYIGKFIFDISRPISEHAGDIYLYTGDGLIGMWDWNTAIENDTIVAVVDALYAAVERERAFYEATFGRVPEFRVGVHGGDVVISEQGDTRKAIGVYGDTINIAARMEQTAKEIGEGCIFSNDIVTALSNKSARFEQKGMVPVRGISDPIEVWGLSLG